jgi:subtilisin family serine protease
MQKQSRSDRTPVESLEQRRMLSTAVNTAAQRLGISPTEVIAEVRDRRGLIRLRNYINDNPRSEAAKLINIGQSSQMYSRGRTTSFVEVELRRNADPMRTVSVLRNLPFVRWSAPNYLYSIQRSGDPRELTPNDPQFANQQHHPQIKTPQAWDTTLGDPNLTVAVLDDGLDLTHGDIASSIFVNPGEVAGDGIDNDANGFIDDVRGWDFGANDNNVQPELNTQFNFIETHGTLVAGIIGSIANNNLGVAGVAPGVKILPVRFYGQGVPFSSITISNSLVYASGMGAKIINISYSIDAFVADPTFQAAVATTFSRGVLWLNSAGNSNIQNPARQNIDEALFVTNVNTDDTKLTGSSGSNYGFGMDLAAPGVNILGLYAGTPGQNLVGRGTGTSFSTAISSGVAALIWSKNPTWTREQVAAQLVGSTDNIDALNPTFVGELGSGRVNAQKAVGATVSAPKLFRVNGLPANNGSTATAPTSFSVDLRSVFNAATVVGSSFALQNAGADLIFGTTDDSVVPITLTNSYKLGTNRLTFNITTPLTTNRLYRFVAQSGPSGLRDPFNQQLDGDGDGIGGDDFVRNFVVGTVTLPTAPAAPTDLAATPNGTTGINLVWTDNSANETGFILERATNNTFTAGLVTTNLAANVNSIPITGLNPATTYFFRVRATNLVGPSAFSNVSSATTDTPTTTLGAPTNLAGLAQPNNQISLNWEDNSATETRFVIQRSRQSNFASITPITVDPNSTSFWDWGLERGTTYFYRVRAETATTQSAWSNTASITTLGTAPTPGGAPTNVVAEAQLGNQVSLSWEDNASDETGFSIERSLTSTFTAVTLRIADANTSGFWDWNLSQGTTYFYRIRAITPTGFSPYSNTATVTTLGVPPVSLGAPTAFTAVAQTGNQIALAWNDNSNNETSFQIQRSLTSTFSTATTRTADADSTGFWDWAVTPGTLYFYRIRAVNGTGVGAWSATTTVTSLGTAPTPLGAPTNLAVLPQAGNQASLSWDDNSSTEVSFLIQRSTSSTFATIDAERAADADTGNYWDFNLTPGTRYYWRIRADGPTASSGWSNVVTLLA